MEHQNNIRAQAAREMHNYNLVVLELCETRWKQSEQLRLTRGEMVLYSGHEESNASLVEGVALLLTKEAQKARLDGKQEDQGSSQHPLEQ